MFNQIGNLNGKEIYLIISLLLFVVFFIGVAIYLLKMNKNYVAKMQNMPFNDQTSPNEYEED